MNRFSLIALLAVAVSFNARAAELDDVLAEYQKSPEYLAAQAKAKKRYDKIYGISEPATVDEANLASARKKLGDISLTTEIARFASPANPSASGALDPASLPAATEDDFGYSTKATLGQTIQRNWIKDVGAGNPHVLQAALGRGSDTPTVSVPETPFVPKIIEVVHKPAQERDEMKSQRATKKVYDQTTVVSPVELEPLDPALVADTIPVTGQLRKKAIDQTTTIGETTLIHPRALEALDPLEVITAPAGYEELSAKQKQHLLHLQHLYGKKLGQKPWQITFARKS